MTALDWGVGALSRCSGGKRGDQEKSKKRLVSLSTTSATVVNNACGTNVPGPSDGFAITVQCGQIANNGATQIGTSSGVTFYQCLSQADQNAQCTSFNYQFSTQACTLFHDATPAYNSVANPDFVFGHFNNG